MEDPIVTVPKSSSKLRTSLFSKKLSSLKAIIHRRTKDDSTVNNSPYTARNRDSKLYMSQPMLALSNPIRPDIDADDDVSDHSTSPERSSLTSTNGYPLLHPITTHARKVSSQSNTGFTIRDSLIKSNLDLTNGAGPHVVLPPTIKISRALDESIPNSLKPGVVGLPPPSDPMGLTFEDKPSKSPSKPLPPVPLPLSSASSEDSIGLDATITPNVNELHPSPDRPTVFMYSSTPVLTETGHSLHIQESSASLRDLPRRERLGPKLTLDTTMNVNMNTIGPGSIINTTSSQQPLFPPVPRRAFSTGAPRPPANYRFSLNLVDGYSARLSPSVILRPPPLPLLNLPVLSRSSTTAADSRRSKRAGLMSMPALPRHGSTRGAAGHEEPDNVEDEDEDEDEDEGDGDGDGVDNHNTSPDSTPLEDDEADTPHSGYSSAAETIPGRRSHSRSPSISSYETVHNKSSTTLHAHDTSFGDPPRSPDKRKPSYLPPVDISRIDLSFLDPPPDKGKSKKLTEDAGRTPTATKRPNRKSVTASTPTMFRRMQSFIPEEPKTDIWAASPVIAKGGQPSSPIQTPRPGGHFNFPLRVLTPPSPPPMHTRSTTENRLSVLSTNTITGNLRASRSLIDVHALEKKEKVEQMVREEEEGAEEERKRRIKAMRRSMRVGPVQGTDKASVVDRQPSGDAESKTSPRSAVSPGISFTSHWVHGNLNENDHSGSGEASSPKKQPRKTNNRISMAPAYETILPLRRRLSMPTFNSTSTPPPPYPDLFPQLYGVKPAQIQPRDDEGREKLPAYSNSIYLKAVMPRKIEFSQPGVQSKDRKWKRVLCVLEGTSFKVYKPPGVSAIGGWWESKVGVGNIVTPASTNNSSNLVGGRQRASGGGVAGVAGEGRGKEENTMATSQSDNANRRHIPITASSSYSSSGPGPGLPLTKSALNLAVHLLIPSSRGHGRTISDVGQPSNIPSALRSPRSSLNIPRITPTPTIDSMTTGTSSSSSRSLSPMFAASSSSLLTTAASSNSSQCSTNSSIRSGGSATSRTVTNNYPAAASSSSFMSKGKKKAEDSLPDEHTLIKAYTMQQAESGLGSDYVKRKNVIRVRLEGEQFLLQAGDVDSVIDWIEGLQAATNIALDLDERPMPRGPLFPRRRRRRRGTGPTTTNAPPGTGTLSPPGDIPLDAFQMAPPLF